MDWKLELVVLPVSDVDRAKAFYVDSIGFHVDHDRVVSDDLRFVQLTPAYLPVPSRSARASRQPNRAR